MIIFQNDIKVHFLPGAYYFYTLENDKIDMKDIIPKTIFNNFYINKYNKFKKVSVIINRKYYFLIILIFLV